MSDWQRVDTKSLNTPRPTKIRGVDVTVYFGHDDMPTGVRGFRRDHEKIVIEFKYNASLEPRKLVHYQDHVVLTAGQISGRLYEVEIDVAAMDVQAIRLLTRVASVLDELPQHAPAFGLNRIDNYTAASGAFKQVQGKLASAITP